MILTAYCPRCEEVRARSRELQPGEGPPKAADFTVVEGQAAPVDGQPAVCTKCNTRLSFLRRLPERENGRHPDPPPAETAGVQTLFSLGHGEEIKAMKELSHDIYVVFTNRRIVKINLNEMAEGGPSD